MEASNKVGTQQGKDKTMQCKGAGAIQRESQRYKQESWGGGVLQIMDAVKEAMKARQQSNDTSNSTGTKQAMTKHSNTKKKAIAVWKRS